MKTYLLKQCRQWELNLSGRSAAANGSSIANVSPALIGSLATTNLPASSVLTKARSLDVDGKPGLLPSVNWSDSVNKILS